MAKKTFTIDAAGVTAGQELDATSTAAKLQGNLNGATVFIEASDTDSNYVDVTGGPIAQNAVTTLGIPSGWYVRARVALRDSGSTPDATLVIE